MALVYLALGTNLGDKEKNLQIAITYISERVGEVRGTSSFYYSKPWNFDSPNEFVNAVVSVNTDLKPLELMKKTQEIERIMGRKTKSKFHVYTDRIIDIDILLYDEIILETDELKIPHPLMQERDFVLYPLYEIASEYIHPVFRKSINELRNEYEIKNQSQSAE